VSVVGTQAARAATRRAPRTVVIVVVAALLGATAAGVAVRLMEEPASRAPVRFEVEEAEGMNLANDGCESAISPDGRMLAFVAGDTARTRLWVRSLETLAARPLEGTNDASLPFWSPDSRNIAFFTNTKLKRVPAAGGDVEELCDVKRARGGAWNRAGVIVFAPTSDGPLYRVSAAGGDPQPVTQLDTLRHETGHRFPQFLPDGRHFLYSVLPPADGRFAICVGSLDSPTLEHLFAASTGVVCAGPDYLLYLRNGTIVAQPFDAARRRLRGNPTSLRDTPSPTSFAGAAGFSASNEGTLAFRTFKLSNAKLQWFDLHEHVIGDVPIEPSVYYYVQISPDDRKAVLVQALPPDRTNICIADLERGVATRFSQEDGVCESPNWSPDGKRIAYAVGNSGPQRFVVRAVDGAASVETYLESDPAFKELYGWSADGRYLVYARQDPVTRWDLWLLPMEGDHTPRPYLRTPFNDQSAVVSRDNRWLSYRSNESGRVEVYVQSFPTAGSKYQVTTAGGIFSHWTPDGKGLAYGDLTNGRAIRVADILPGPEFRLGPARNVGAVPERQRSADLAHDGKRLLVLMPAGKEPTNTLTVVMNWMGTLQGR